MRALEAGKHVLCEKPYSRHATDVEEAFDLAERRGLVLSEAFMWRHNPQTRRVLKLLPEIGELQTIRATFGFKLTRDDDVRLRADLDGGSLMDVGCYCVSGARLLAGEPERVLGEQVVGTTGVDVRFTGILHFANDVLADFTSSFTHGHSGLEAIGSDGMLVVPGSVARATAAHRRQRPRGERQRRDPRRGTAPARPRRRARPGEDHRGAVRGRGGRQKPKWTFVKYQSADVAHSAASTDAIIPPITGSTQRGCRRSCTKNTFTTNTP